MVPPNGHPFKPKTNRIITKMIIALIMMTLLCTGLAVSLTMSDGEVHKLRKENETLKRDLLIYKKT